MAKNKSKASLGRPLPDAKRPRNPFDRSFSINFNTKNGFLEPCFSEYLPAGAHCEINRSEIIRTADVNTAAMIGFDHFIDFYAVPLHQLWSDWDNWYLNLRDSKSSMYSIMNTPSDPLGVSPQRSQCFAMSVNQMLLYIDSVSNYAVPGTGETRYDPAGVNPQYSSVIFSHNARRLLNRLNYGVAYDPEGLNFDNLTPDDYGYVHDMSNQYQNLFRLLAYQKVYYDHYRNTSYEVVNPAMFNIDWITPDTTPTPDQCRQMFKYIANLHSVNYRKDFFQSVYPALDYVVVEGSVVDGFQVPSNVVQAFGWLDMPLSGNTSTDSNRYVDPSNRVQLYTGTGTLPKNPIYLNSESNWASYTHDHGVGSLSAIQSISPSAYNVQAIRAAFALDKLKRQSAYAPRYIKDQYEARFGFTYKGDHHMSVRIGSFKSGVQLSEVTQTTPTEGSPLGTIGGKGVSGSNYGETLEFTASQGDCLIIGVQYFMPRLMYDGFCLDPFNVKYRRNDFFQPEFENLGLQPLYHKFFRFADTTEMNEADEQNNVIRGYQTRYQEYKTGINRNYGLFNSGNQLNVFTSSFNMSKRYLALPGLNWQLFKVRPEDVNNIFVSGADANELSDQFYGFINFHFKCNQNMSVHGQPIL